MVKTIFDIIGRHYDSERPLHSSSDAAEEVSSLFTAFALWFRSNYGRTLVVMVDGVQKFMRHDYQGMSSSTDYDGFWTFDDIFQYWLNNVYGK